MASHTSTIAELLAQSFSRYITVTPQGLRLRPGLVLESVALQVLTFRPARTLYQSRKPVCRSLDGIQALSQGRTCAACLLRKACTPQLSLDVLYQGIPLRLMLAYSSARNFMVFLAKLKDAGTPIEGATVTILVRNRGRWGELCFQQTADSP